MSQNFNRRAHVFDALPVYHGAALTPGPSPEGRGEKGEAPAALALSATREGSRPNGASDTEVQLRPPSEGAAANEANGPAGGAPPAGEPLPVIRCASGTNVAAVRQTVAAAQAHFRTGARAVAIEDPAGRRLVVSPAVIARLAEHLRRIPHQGTRERARRLRRGHPPLPAFGGAA